ncbi:hypothetical protein OG320_31480 [Microbispora sp. NBC_01189]|uniref:Rv1733c family protein n=1 Tax=Microbispora sp. NBC_01189 TaxID=2903583 RepID=UPI002E0DCBC2|nr:hypothetical protein OG320_31480 [Microbispora sp. NBC_01189]
MRSIARWVVAGLRRYRPDRNPLRRRSDRVEAGIVAAVLVTALLAVWPAALAARAAYGGGPAAAGPGARHLVEATLTGGATASAADAHVLLEATAARWTLPDGGVREGMVPAALLLRDGPRARLWIDGEGRPATPPPHRAEMTARAGLAASGVMAGAVALAAACLVLARRRLDRARYRAWDAAWADADQRWRRHRI